MSRLGHHADIAFVQAHNFKGQRKTDAVSPGIWPAVDQSCTKWSHAALAVLAIVFSRVSWSA